MNWEEKIKEDLEGNDMLNIFMKPTLKKLKFWIVKYGGSKIEDLLSYTSFKAEIHIL